MNQQQWQMKKDAAALHSSPAHVDQTYQKNRQWPDEERGWPRPDNQQINVTQTKRKGDFP
jgi:hypothetical protein